MVEEVTEIIESVRDREIGVEVAKNILLFNSGIIPTLIEPAKEEIIDILESIQYMLLEVSVGVVLINETIKKYGGLH